MELGEVAIAIVILAVVIGIVGWAYYAIYVQPATYNGVVSSYTFSKGILGFTDYYLIFYGGENISWSTWSFLPIFNNVGGNINATAGETCTLTFKGSFMQSYNCTKG